MDAAGLPRLTDNDLKFLAEYTRLMGCVARALDILQAEKKMFYGYLAPTIETLRNNIKGEQSGGGLRYCEPLAKALLEGISKRFDDVVSQEDAILAAVVHPRFRAEWIKHGDESLRTRAVELLKAAVVKEIRTARETGAHEHTLTSLCKGKEEHIASNDDDDDFFSFRSARTNQGLSIKTPEEEAKDEVQKYLETKSSDSSISILHSFPHLKQVFLKVNSPLPSSAAVERLFSLSGLLFNARRARLSDQNLEMTVLLKTNEKFVNL